MGEWACGTESNAAHISSATNGALEPIDEKSFVTWDKCKNGSVSLAGEDDLGCVSPCNAVDWNFVSTVRTGTGNQDRGNCRRWTLTSENIINAELPEGDDVKFRAWQADDDQCCVGC